MSQKFIVTAVDRSAKGLHHVHRAGRAWPSSQDVVVEVLDQDACPMVKASKEGYPDLPDPNKLGRIAWAAVMADGRLSKRPFGTAPDASEVDALKAKVSELTAELNGRDVVIQQLHEALRLGAEEVDKYIKENTLITQESEEAKKKAAELTALLESATAQQTLPMVEPAKADEPKKSTKGK